MEFKFSKALLVFPKAIVWVSTLPSMMTTEAGASLSQLQVPAPEACWTPAGGVHRGGGGGPANVSLTRSGTSIVLEWEGGGSLQTAPAVTGPWGRSRCSVGCRSRPREGGLLPLR